MPALYTMPSSVTYVANVLHTLFALFYGSMLFTTYIPSPQNSPDSRAALSLLGHCYYQSAQFEPAMQM